MTGTDSSEADGGPRVGPSGSREVVVPIRLYKTITVFSTIIAIAAILGGFILLDVATNRTQADPSEVNVALALAGVGLLALGTVTYAFSTRFRTEGMGDLEDGSDGSGSAEDDSDGSENDKVETAGSRTAEVETAGNGNDHDGTERTKRDQDGTERMGNAKNKKDEREYNDG